MFNSRCIEGVNLNLINFYKIFCILFLFLCSALINAAEKIEVQALMPGMVVLLIDGERTTLKAGASAQGVKMISSTTKSAVLEINGEQSSYQMGTTIGTSFIKPEMIIERVVSDSRGMFRSYGSINGHSVRFLIDTGASSVAISAREARKLGIQYHLIGIPARANTASGTAKAWVVKFKTVRLGKLLEHNVEGMVVDGDYPTQVLLGMTFLNRMKVEKESNTMKITRKK